MQSSMHAVFPPSAHPCGPSYAHSLIVHIAVHVCAEQLSDAVQDANLGELADAADRVEVSLAQSPDGQHCHQQSQHHRGKGVYEGQAQHWGQQSGAEQARRPQAHDPPGGGNALLNWISLGLIFYLAVSPECKANAAFSLKGSLCRYALPGIARRMANTS